nr:small nuclear ribonucleoprotein E-like [Cryptomonas curvata]
MSIKEFFILNPKNFLNSLLNKKILVRLKWGIEYKGNLVSYDNYFNIRIRNTEEWIEGKEIGKLGEIVIRCNNIQFVAEVN